MVGTLVVVTLVLAWAGEDGTVFAADDETGNTGGVVEALVGLAVGAVLGLVEFGGLAWTVLTVVVMVVAAVGEDFEVCFGEAVAGQVAVAETFWVAAGAGVTVAGAEACGKSFTAVVLAGTDFTVVVTAGVTLFDITLVAVVIAVAGTDVGTTLTAMAEDDTVDGVVAAGVATVVVLAESGPVVFTVVETEGFGSTGALEAVETTSVGFTPGRVEVTVLAGGSGVVVVGVAVTEIVADVESVTEDAGETWVDGVLLTGAELTNWTEADVEAATGRGAVTWGAGAVGAWIEAETGVEG